MSDLLLAPTAIEPAVDLSTRHDATLHAIYRVDVEGFERVGKTAVVMSTHGRSGASRLLFGSHGVGPPVDGVSGSRRSRAPWALTG